MPYIGQIEAAYQSAPIDGSEWMGLIDSHRALRHVPPKMGVNPFTRKSCEFKAPASSAQVAANSARVGGIQWAMDGSPYLLVDADDEWIDFVATIAEEVASTLGARFVRKSEG